ncbi:class I SAM-dependent methyltransferase [Longispora sp. NPDC051575]|uniref:class I SAM-dependent methyltransferase n=1 Tax=Longispora sp. NPDC051575 TaxID=3154943 RepID=UPI00341984C7
MPPRSAASRTLDPRTRELLAAVNVEGAFARLTEQVTSAEYAPIGAILDTLGGCWSRSAQAIVFPSDVDPRRLIDQVLESGIAPLPARTREAFVPTPDDLADDLCAYPYTDLAWLPEGARVLDPAAGYGALTAAMLRANPGVHVTAVEPHPGRAAACATLGERVDVHNMTLEEFATRAIRAGDAFDAIVMNPPFAIPGEPTLWMDHLRHAWHLLRPGASLVSVVPESLAHRGDAAHRGIRTLIEHNGFHRRLPPASFAASGSPVNTRVVRMVKAFSDVGLDTAFSAPTDPPVRVADPRMTAEAVTDAPVQVWWDSWRRRDRVLRYRARCVLCGWLLWGFDDGENDPRGVLGDFSSGFSLDADDYEQAGPSIGLCTMCANDGDLYRAGLARAQAHWQPARSLAPTLAVA